MNNSVTALINEAAALCANMYRLGWDERNGGNLSVLLPPEHSVSLPAPAGARCFPTGFSVPALGGRCLLVTASGSYFRHATERTEEVFGILRLDEAGENAEVLWGLAGGGHPTSELAAHLMSHAARLSQDNAHRVVLHCHPTQLLAMTFVHSLEEAAFTRSLWRTVTECMMVFPDGVGLLPWMMCGTKKIGEATAEKMRQFRLVVWPHHGIYGTGRDMDEAFGLVETVEKAAQIYMLTYGKEIKNTITDDNLREIAETLVLDYRKDFLK